MPLALHKFTNLKEKEYKFVKINHVSRIETGGGGDDFSKLHYYLSLIVNCTNEVKCLLYLPFCNRQYNYLLSVK